MNLFHQKHIPYWHRFFSAAVSCFLCLFYSTIAQGQNLSSWEGLGETKKFNIARLHSKKNARKEPVLQAKVLKGDTDASKRPQILGMKDRAFCLKKSAYLSAKNSNNREKISQAFDRFKRDQEISATVRADIALILVCEAKHIAKFFLRKNSLLSLEETELLKAFLGVETGEAQRGSTENDKAQQAAVALPNVAPTKPKNSHQPHTSQRAPFNGISSKADLSRSCLFADLNRLRPLAFQQSTPVALCSTPCLPKPTYLEEAQRLRITKLYGIKWCAACLTLKRFMSSEEMELIERAGGIKLCPKQQIKPHEISLHSASDYAGMVRGFFAPNSHAKKPHNRVGIIISQQAFKQPRLKLPRAHVQGRAIAMAMTEKMGYVSDNIVEKHDLTKRELAVFFGTASKRGELQKFLHQHKTNHLTLYMTGRGAMDRSLDHAYILGTDSRADNIARTSLKLADLLRVLEQLPVPSIDLILDMGFHPPLDQLVVSPNMPIFKVQVLPIKPNTKVTILTAGMQDQHLLIDRDTGLGLYTKHLVGALTGGADRAPFGNQDGVVDIKEVYIYAAQRTRTSSVKSFGVFQTPDVLFAARAKP